ncbi:MAG: EF-Tu/IF-2/RF-3 family GTPase [Polaromonas sp.]
MQSQSQISELLRSPFRANVEEVFSIPGATPNSIRGTVLVVKVFAGVLKSGGNVFVSSWPSLNLMVTAIERNKLLVDEAYITERVGLMFKDVDLSTVQPGQIVSALV